MVATLESVCADATKRPECQAIAGRLNVEARYLPGAAFRKLFNVLKHENTANGSRLING
ncbi:MAG: hypothetical protein K2Y71_24875 [Xanthobacteraceae bacterium]|nr:hypothetical protein [Xanthobacteraceae bacterium]